MRLDQNRGAISKRNVARRKPRRAIEVARSQRQVSVINELEIPGDNVTGILGGPNDCVVEYIPLPLKHSRVDTVVVLMVVGDVATIVSAVRHVTVNKKIGFQFFQ